MKVVQVTTETEDTDCGETINRVVGPDEARLMRDTMAFALQRNIEKRNVDRLAREMDLNRFNPWTQIYIGVLPDGTKLILNGNHTLEAVCKSGKPQRLAITEVNLDDMHHAARIYSAFDNQRMRTIRDAIRASGKYTGFGDDALFGSAIRLILDGFRQHGSKKVANRLDINEQIYDYSKAGELYKLALEGCTVGNRNLLKCGPVMSVALETLRWHPEMAFGFWHAVAQEDGLAKLTPEHTLLCTLRLRPHGLPHGPAVRARIAACAWNAKWLGKMPKSFQYSRSSFKLLGTPFVHGV